MKDLSKYIGILIAFSISSCAHVEVAENYDAWEPIGYKGFSGKINKTGGPNSLNCGFHNLMTKEGKKSSKSGLRCAIKAAKSGSPFRYGTVRLPIDSYAYEIIVLSPDSEYWLVVYDIMVDGTSPQQWIKKCKDVSFSSKHMDYEGKECEEVPNDNWL